jgi:hypothetical protein
MMIVERRNLISLPNYGRVYFIKDNMFYRAMRKQGSHNTHGTLKDLRKRISIKDDSIVELGLVEESFQNMKEI